MGWQGLTSKSPTEPGGVGPRTKLPGWNLDTDSGGLIALSSLFLHVFEILHNKSKEKKGLSERLAHEPRKKKNNGKCNVLGSKKRNASGRSGGQVGQVAERWGWSQVSLRTESAGLSSFTLGCPWASSRPALTLVHPRTLSILQPAGLPQSQRQVCGLHWPLL